MSAITFDTLKLSRKLESAGFTHEQATGAAAALADSFESEVVTESKLDLRLKELELRLIKWLIPLLLGQAAIVIAAIKLLST